MNELLILTLLTMFSFFCYVVAVGTLDWKERLTWIEYGFPPVSVVVTFSAFAILAFVTVFVAFLKIFGI